MKYEELFFLNKETVGLFRVTSQGVLVQTRHNCLTLSVGGLDTQKTITAVQDMYYSSIGYNTPFMQALYYSSIYNNKPFLLPVYYRSIAIAHLITT